MGAARHRVAALRYTSPVTAELRWLLAYTKPCGEHTAEENLRRQGFEVFSPGLSLQKRRRGKWVWVDEPLFPRYVFIGARPDQSLAPIRSTVGVSALVRFGGEVAEVPAALIAQLQGAAEVTAGRQYRFKQGQPVRIVGENFSAIEGVFEMQEGEARAHVLVTLLGRPIVVQVSLADVVPEETT